MSLKEPKKKLGSFHVWGKLDVFESFSLKNYRNFSYFAKSGFFGRTLEKLMAVFKLVACWVFYKEPHAFLIARAKSRPDFRKAMPPIWKRGRIWVSRKCKVRGKNKGLSKIV
jgi:hypothetical protein